MNDRVAAMEAEGWERDITVAGHPLPGHTPFGAQRTRHLRGRGFETARIAAGTAESPVEIVMKRRKAHG